jgi:hypothetical protein
VNLLRLGIFDNAVCQCRCVDLMPLSFFSAQFVLLWVYCTAEIISEEAVLQWIAAREALEEDVQEDLAEGADPSSTVVVMGAATTTILASDRVKLFREPAVQAFVEWVQEEDESSEEGEEGSSEEEDD